jgi:hypothetical protein
VGTGIPQNPALYYLSMTDLVDALIDDRVRIGITAHSVRMDHRKCKANGGDSLT